MDAVEQQRQKLLDEIQALPADVLQKASEFVARLRQKALHSNPEQRSDEVTSKTPSSPYEAFEKAGLIGCIKDAPPDLSVNYKAA